MTQTEPITDGVFARSLGRTLRKYRESRGYSREQLAERLTPRTIKTRTLTTYELGKRNITVDRLRQICDALGKTAASVIAESEVRADAIRRLNQQTTNRMRIQEALTFYLEKGNWDNRESARAEFYQLLTNAGQLTSLVEILAEHQ